jgi:hypothetical protein
LDRKLIHFRLLVLRATEEKHWYWNTNDVVNFLSCLLKETIKNNRMSKKKKIKRNLSKTVYSDKPIEIKIKKLYIQAGKKKEKISTAIASLILKDLILQDISNSMSEVGEMGEMESLRMQMAMDRMSKMMSTLSNLLKKISQTATEITQNLK